MLLKTSLDVVLPCNNPGLDWEKKALFHYQQLRTNINKNVEINVFIVDDGSCNGIDSTQIDFLKKNIPCFKFITYNKNLGKGYALRTAVKQTTSQIIIYTDIDFPYRMENITEIYKLLSEDKVDIAVGVRNGNYYKKLPLTRVIISLALKIINFIVFPRLVVKDTQSGLKGFNTKGKEVFLKTKINSFLFDLEFLVLASRKKDLNISWITVEAREDITFSTIKWKTIKTELINFAYIFRNVR